MCLKVFKHKFSLQYHKRMHSGEKLYVCDMCKKTFPLLAQLKVHMRIHRGDRPYSCSYCDAKFTQAGTRNRHERIQHIITKGGAFKCDICSKTFRGKGNLKMHMVIHTGERLFSCSYCGANFSRYSSQRRHEQVIHSNAPIQVICDVCSKTFSEKGYMKLHMRIHTGERSYSCSYCEAAFTQPGTRNRHERIQHLKTSDEFKCDICTTTFSLKGNLKKHMVIHTGEWPFACSYCGAKFTQLGTKNKHERIQHMKTSDEFKCKLCSKTFSEKGNLKQHMVVHTGERPYTCSYCDATFTQVGSRNLHERTKHPKIKMLSMQ